MLFRIITADLFKQDCHLVHCVAADIGWDAKSGTMGIAKKFVDDYFIKEMISMYVGSVLVGTCVKTDDVFNLITKPRYFNKPTYQTLKDSLISLRHLLIANRIDKIAMPEIGCGLDKLEWDKVRDIIFEVFNDIQDLEIIVCKKP